MAERGPKSDTALRTIGEVSADLGVPQHILRYWETRFPQLKPMQRAGNRRYYRPADVALARRIHGLLNVEGYTMRGVAQLLAAGGEPAEKAAPDPLPAPVPPEARSGADFHARTVALRRLRDTLTAALAADEGAAGR